MSSQPKALPAPPSESSLEKQTNDDDVDDEDEARCSAMFYCFIILGSIIAGSGLFFVPRVVWKREAELLMLSRVKLT